jgi:hypothetical protein
MWEREKKLLSDFSPEARTYSNADFSYLLRLLSSNQEDDYFQKILESPPVVKQSSYLQIVVRVQLLPIRFEPLKKDAELTTAILIGYPTVEKYKAATAAPYLFPFSQKKELLDKAEEFTGMKSLSQLITGYRYRGIIQLAGDNILDIERVICSELSNFPPDDLSVVIIRSAGEGFCDSLCAGGVCTLPINELGQGENVHTGFPLLFDVDISSCSLLSQDIFDFLINNERSATSYILSPIVSRYLYAHLKNNHGVVRTSIVSISSEPSIDNLLYSEYAVFFRGVPESFLLEYGFFNIDDYTVVIYVEEEENIRFFLSKLGSEPQLQIYPWS